MYATTLQGAAIDTRCIDNALSSEIRTTIKWHQKKRQKAAKTVLSTPKNAKVSDEQKHRQDGDKRSEVTKELPLRHKVHSLKTNCS
jgi:hypothetical protein